MPDPAFAATDWTAYVIFIGVVVLYILQSLLANLGSWYLLALGLIGIVVMLFAPRGLWGLFTERTGIQLFPVRRILTPRQSDN